MCGAPRVFLFHCGPLDVWTYYLRLPEQVPEEKQAQMCGVFCSRESYMGSLLLHSVH